MLDNILNSLYDTPTYHVVKLDLWRSPRDLTDELNQANVQPDMVLLTTCLQDRTLVMIFASNQRTKSQGIADLLQHLSQFSSPEAINSDSNESGEE